MLLLKLYTHPGHSRTRSLQVAKLHSNFTKNELFRLIATSVPGVPPCYYSYFSRYSRSDFEFQSGKSINVFGSGFFFPETKNIATLALL